MGCSVRETFAAFQSVDFSPVSSNALVVPGVLTAGGTFPQGSKVFGGVPFNLGKVLVVSGMDDVRAGKLFPPRIREIPVHAVAAQLYLLQGVDGDDKDGVPYASVVFHYDNGARRSVRLAHGVHARGWPRGRKKAGEQVLDPGTRLAWSSPAEDSERGTSGLRVYQTAIPNPLPEQRIDRLELITLFSQGTPFVAGIAASDQVPEAMALSDDASLRRVAKKSLEFPDSVYHSEFLVRAMDAVTGQGNAGATAALTIGDDAGMLYLGDAAADPSGVIHLPYPPQQTVAFSILVRAPGRVPVVLEGAKLANGNFDREFVAKLERGVRMGGVVNDPAGHPVSGAEIVVHQVSPSGPREFLRLDYETVRTGADGKWTTEAVGSTASNLSFEVSHPEFRPATYALAESREGDGNSVRKVELLAGTAGMVLQPSLRVAGTLVADGLTFGQAELALVDPASPGVRRPIPVAADGTFTVIVPQPGEIWLMARAAGFRPTLQQTRVDPETRSLRILMTKASALRGRVLDQSQAPVAGARVRLDSWNGTKLLPWQAVADEKGYFEWDSPPDGNLMLYISAAGYNSMRTSLSGTTGERRFTLRKMARVVGHVVDADTLKPIDDFIVVRGRAYNEGEAMRWDRYDSTRGRRGEYSARLLDYGSNVRLQIMVEAQGYMPAVSPEFSKADVYTNDFALRKARGISGVVQLADGTPVANATLALVEPSDSAYMDKPGELRRSSSGGDYQRSNVRGQFEFAPKLNPHTILASHALGFAEVRASNVVATGTVALQPWARVSGRVRVGPGSQQGKTVQIRSMDWEYGVEDRTGPPLSLSLRTETDADGKFVVDRVPPGERVAELQVKVNDRSSGRGMATTHGTAMEVKPGASTEVLIGGTGRPVIGRMTITGGEPEDVDWLRDVHQMSTMRALPTTIVPPMITGAMSEPERQKAYREYNERQRAYWMTDEGRALRRKDHRYTLMFETNGTFRVDNVEPGRYQIYVSLTNPDRPDNYYEHIGSMNKEVTVPPATKGREDEPFDLGEMSVPVRGLQRTGRRAPVFELKTYDGRDIKSESLKGRYVFLDFWATWAGSRNLDVQMLKSVYAQYEKDDRLVMIGMNFDPDAATGEKYARDNGFKWMQCHGGRWGESPIISSFGMQGLPDNVLIDPEGKIVARNLRGSNIRNTIRAKVGPPPNVPRAAQP